jgi:hypothetical protein
MHTYICTYIYTYIYIQSYIPSFVRAAIPTQVDIRACACPHARAHMSPHERQRASAVPPRATARAASNTRRARPARGGARPGPERPAHTLAMFDTDAMFHAPMFALNAAADRNACKPNHTRSTPTERARMCPCGCVGARSLTHKRARATHTRARIGGPAAHNRPRRFDDPPSASHRQLRAARAEKAAHTPDNVVTEAVFHAPMFALNVFADWNACKRNACAVHADGTRSHVSAPMRGPLIANAQMRARTHAARGPVCAAGPHRRSDRRRSQTRIMATCMQCVSIYYTCACSVHGLTKRARRTRTRAAYSRIISARTRSHAYARTHTRNHSHTRACHRCYIPICVYMTCALAIYPGRRTHACKRDGTGRIVGAHNRTHVCMRGGAAAGTPIPVH